ncbi:AraC family transcriptional regulator [Chloroflexi bacterium TSY]|nr:AraC family transcriptional regulator [Chloroflexi bacterium TSY]
MDILSELMRSVGTNPAFVVQGNIPKPWGLQFPTSRGAAFHLVIRGTCWVRSSALETPIQLEAGDLAFISGQLAYDLVSDLETEAKSIHQSKATWLYGPLSEAELVNVTSFICGIYRFALKPIHPFFTELPKLIHVRSHQIAAHEPMYAAMRLLSAELAYSNSEPGKSMLLDRLVDVMLYYILRQWMSSQPKEGASWTRAFYDPQLRNALIAIHENPAHPWQVGSLAQKAGLSRAMFAQRFKQLLGDTPINYMTKVRIQKAMELLVQTEESIDFTFW